MRTLVDIMLIAMAICLLASIVSGCSKEPSACEKAGGEQVYTHTILIPNRIGNVTVLQQYPQFRCELPSTGETHETR